VQIFKKFHVWLPTGHVDDTFI